MNVTNQPFHQKGANCANWVHSAEMIFCKIYTLFFFSRMKLSAHTQQKCFNSDPAALRDLDCGVSNNREWTEAIHLCVEIEKISGSRLKPTLSCWILMSWLSAIARKHFRFSSSSRMYTGTPRKDASTTSLNMSTSVNVSITMEMTCVEKASKSSSVTAMHRCRASCRVLKDCSLNQQSTISLKGPVCKIFEEAQNLWKPT